MLKLCLNFNESQPLYAYKQYAYKEECSSLVIQIFFWWRYLHARFFNVFETSDDEQLQFFPCYTSSSHSNEPNLAFFFYLRSTSHLINGWFYREDTGKRVHICQQ